MSDVFMFGDLHGGHKNIHKYRGFESEIVHWEFCRDRYHSVIGKNDLVYVLGDCCFTYERLAEFKQWAGRKILILGNHDTEQMSLRTILESNTFESIHSMFKYRGMLLTHAPVHPAQLRGKHNVHGHVHENTIRDSRYLNVSLENIGYTPLALSEIKQIVQSNQIYSNQLSPDQIGTNIDKRVTYEE